MFLTKTEKKEVLMHKLTPNAYKALEDKCPYPCLDSRGNADFNLGVQYVLRLLREGFCE